MINGQRFVIEGWLPSAPGEPLRAALVWYAETDQILRVNWDKLEPTEIAERVNRWLIKWKTPGKKQNTTSELGGGVIARARALGMISPDEFKELYGEYVLPHFYE